MRILSPIIPDSAITELEMLCQLYIRQARGGHSLPHTSIYRMYYNDAWLTYRVI